MLGLFFLQDSVDIQKALTSVEKNPDISVDATEWIDTKTLIKNLATNIITKFVVSS